MEGSKGSFIPKNPVGSVTKKRPVKKLYVFTFLVYAFFVGSIVVAAGTFLYQFTQDQQLATKSEELQQVSDAFDPSLLGEIVALDTKISQAAQLLTGYNSLPTLLRAVEEVTVSSVQLTSFSFTQGSESAFELTMTANNPDFNVALFQREQLENNQIFNNAEITDIQYSADTEDAPGGVTFTITNSLAPGAVAYRPSLPTSLPAASPSPTEPSLQENSDEVVVDLGDTVPDEVESIDQALQNDAAFETDPNVTPGNQLTP